ncbi:MAG TPA: galactitol-1-phosphate 5-dehydrogenase [Candidatus Hydrogenedens sp.]|nr:galactitol-1-phosphate 5-dehydrogenase [Candidatus Hydrogenedens sp.]
MKALRLHKVGDLRLEDVPTPFPQATEVLLRISACGVCGSDIPRIFEHGTYKYPLVPGHELSGVVENVGLETSRDWIGKHVVVYPLIPCRQCSACYSGYPTQCSNYDYIGSRRDGGFAEYVTVPADNIIPVPEGIPLELSALTEPCAVAFHAVHKMKVSPGDSVLITGSGTIGLLIAIWCRNAGAHVFMTDIVVDKLRFARSLGFQHLLDATQASVHQWIKQKTSYGIDIAFETTGHPSGIESAIESCRINGQIVLVGNPALNEMKINSKCYSLILRRELSIVGVWNSLRNEYSKNEWNVVLQEFKREGNPFLKLVTHRVPIEELKDTLIRMYNKEIFPVKVMMINEED